MVKSRRDESVDVSGEKNSFQTVALTLIDTTWRMFLPTLALAGVGFKVDEIFGSKPGFFVVGAVLGFVVAVLLVKKQLGQLKNIDNGDQS